MAMQSPPEKLAYLALINPKRAGVSDAIGVVDVDPESNGYGRLVGQTDMPHAGDELHATGTTPMPVAGSAALAIHTIAYFATMTAAVHLVYRKFGLSLLRQAWINLDWLWAAALMVTGVVVFVS